MAYPITTHDYTLTGLISITGGPSSGKTSVLERLAKEGYYTIRGAATDIIAEQLGKGIVKPWAKLEFEDGVVRTQQARAEAFLDSGYPFGFTERCEVDPHTYAKLFHKWITPIVEEAYAYATGEESIYQPTAFLMDPLPTFDGNDIRGQEKDHPELAKLLDMFLEAAYTEAGFTVVRVPVDRVGARSTAEEDIARATQISVALRTNTILHHCRLPVLPINS